MAADYKAQTPVRYFPTVKWYCVFINSTVFFSLKHLIPEIISCAAPVTIWISQQSCWVSASTIKDYIPCRTTLIGAHLHTEHRQHGANTSVIQPLRQPYSNKYNSRGHSVQQSLIYDTCTTRPPVKNTWDDDTERKASVTQPEVSLHKTTKCHLWQWNVTQPECGTCMEENKHAWQRCDQYCTIWLLAVSVSENFWNPIITWEKGTTTPQPQVTVCDREDRINTASYRLKDSSITLSCCTWR